MIGTDEYKNFWITNRRIDMDNNQVYLDQNQCATFGLDYFEADTAALRADEILSSKWQGYDASHTQRLQPLGSQIVNLARERADAPGWYNIVTPQKMVDPNPDTCPSCGVAREPGDPVHGGVRCDCWQQ
jgi:hypothetical protein